jgi:hypothetical protein
MSHSIERAGLPAPAVACIAASLAVAPADEQRERNEKFIAAVCSAKLGEVKSVLTSIKSGAQRAALCQLQALNEDGECAPLLKLAAQKNFGLIARHLLHNGAIQNVLELYSDDEREYEANVRKAGWKCSQFDLAPLIREFILFHHGDSLADGSLKTVVENVGMGTLSVTRDTLLIAAVKRSSVFAQTILDMDPFDQIYDQVIAGNLAADKHKLDALNVSHRSPGSEWKNAFESANGQVKEIIRRKGEGLKRKREQLLFYLCTNLSADALEWFKYLMLPERRDVDKQADPLTFCCKYNGQFEGHALASKFKKGDTFLHVAARFETDSSSSFFIWLLDHSQLALELKNCDKMDPAACANDDAVRHIMEQTNLRCCARTPRETTSPQSDASSFMAPYVSPSHPFYDVFISYRNDTEANFATALYRILSSPPFNMIVFLDKYSLDIGYGRPSADQPAQHQNVMWMTDLYKAIHNSRIILILVSHEGTVAPFAHLSVDGIYPDACLAEHFFANILNRMRIGFQPGDMKVPNNMITVLIGPHPDPFVPLLPLEEYKELKQHIRDEPHNVTVSKCLEAMVFCVAPRFIGELKQQHSTLHTQLRSTKQIFGAVTCANCIRPHIECEGETTFFGKLENIARRIHEEVKSKHFHPTEHAIDEHAPFIKIILSGCLGQRDENGAMRDEKGVRQAVGTICQEARVNLEYTRIRGFFVGSIGVDVEICSPVEAPLTCTDVIKRLLRAHRSGLLTKCCPPYDVLDIQVADPLQLWRRIIDYECLKYGTLEHSEVQFSMRELEASQSCSILLEPNGFEELAVLEHLTIENSAFPPLPARHLKMPSRMQQPEDLLNESKPTPDSSCSIEKFTTPVKAKSGTGTLLNTDVDGECAVTFASWNIRKLTTNTKDPEGWLQRKLHIISSLRALAPDFIAIQEVCSGEHGKVIFPPHKTASGLRIVLFLII